MCEVTSDDVTQVSHTTVPSPRPSMSFEEEARNAERETQKTPRSQRGKTPWALFWKDPNFLRNTRPPFVSFVISCSKGQMNSQADPLRMSGDAVILIDHPVQTQESSK